MKIEIKDYANFLKGKFPSNHLLIEKMVNEINNNLQCKECMEILPFEKFHKSKSFENRGGRYSICKDCITNMREQGRR